MNPEETAHGIQRIVVAVDTSSQSLIALKTAANLSTRLMTDVIGLYIEDIDLLRGAEFVFLYEISYYSARSQPVSGQVFELQYRANGRWLQQVIQNLSRNSDQRWSLQTSRGSIAREILRHLLETDLLILSRAALPGLRRVGSPVRSLVNQPPQRALILSRPIHPESSVMILFDGSESSQRALVTSQLFITANNPMQILILSVSFDLAQRLQVQARTIISPAAVRIRYHWLRITDPTRISQLARCEDCGLLVVPIGSVTFPPDSLLTLIDQTNCSILLIQ